MSRYSEIARELGLDGTVIVKQASVQYSDPVAADILGFLNKESQAMEQYPVSSMLMDIQNTTGIEIDPEVFEFTKRAEVAGFKKTEIEGFLFKQAAEGLLGKIGSLLMPGKESSHAFR
jgi:hypothetical protein